MEILIAKIEQFLPRKKIDIFGRDSLMFSTLPYYLLSATVLVWVTKIVPNSYAIIFFVYTFIPLFDQLFSHDERNPTEEERKVLIGQDSLFKLALYVNVAIDWYLFFHAMAIFADHEWTVHSTIQLVGFIFLYSNLNAVQFAVAHQICHKPGKINRWIGTLHTSKMLYMHWIYQHLYGHHRKLGTPEDPASAIQGDSVYTFFPKTFIGSYTSVYKMQKEEQGKSFLFNYAVLSVVGAVAFTGLVFYFYNLQTMVIFMICALGAIFYLESINYIEHYGLRRQKLANGQYEKVTIRHSWNAPHRFSNYLLFKLQRHSDHHQNSTKPYQTLLSLEQSPHMPHGYSILIFMSFFPQVWFKVMDPVVEEYKRVKNGKIESQVMLKSMKETRKFIIQLGAATLLLWIISMIL